MTETTRNHHVHTEAYRRGDQSPEAIEHEIDEERRSVSQTIEALQEKMSVGSMVDEAWRRYGHYGNDIGRNLGRTVSENPMPLILTGVGLAWLMFSSGRSRKHDGYDEDYLWEADEDLYEEDFVGTRRSGTTGARPYGTAAVGGTYERRGNKPSMTERVRGAVGSAYESARSAVGSATHRAGDAVGSATHRASDAGRSAYGSASQYAGGAASYASESGRGAAGGMSRAAGGIGDRAREAGETMSRSAEEARRQAAYYGRYTRRRMDDMIDDHPLVMGALALAIGAAIGGALPRTRIEDEYLGEYSEEAWDMAEGEVEKARRVAGAVADEARHIAEEKYEEASGEARSLAEKAKHQAGETAERLRHRAEDEARGAADRAKTEAREAADRLGETAREESRKQELGNPNKSA